MIEKYRFGHPVVQTGATVHDIPLSEGSVNAGTIKSSWPFIYEYALSKVDRVYGLGENVRGINKRGFTYTSWCSDIPGGGERESSLYGAHNFLIITGGTAATHTAPVGLFFDTPAKITFDIGWTEPDTLSVTSDTDGLYLYVITSGEQDTKGALKDIVRQFRLLIGQSYIPPLWAFGYQQSRWGYKTEADVRAVVEKHRTLGLPLDSVCLDIDYMDEYMDFTVDKAKFPDFAALNKDMAKQGVHLIPIIDAGVKAKPGYAAYDEGVANGYFCKKEDGSLFTAGVWPGKSAFTDFFKSNARSWFGSKYKALTDCGVEGFWNDMNEPSLFYTDEGLQEAFEKFESYKGKELDINTFFEFTSLGGSTSCRLKDYKSFFHEVSTGSRDEANERVSHDRVHNIYGALMTKAAREGLDKLKPGKRTLLYSRASCIGAHRDGGIWMGDNSSAWSNIELELHMLPSLNMCGFLYTGADIGGFGDSASRDLVLRWLALGVFTPLMRNHAAWNARNQECYAFGDSADFKSLLNLRYALLPYIYSEFVKASVLHELLFKPLAFEYPDDETACDIEDELLFGKEVLIAPVYKQNARGRFVYLPEDMTQITWKDSKAEQTLVHKGTHYINIPEDTVVFFVRPGKSIPLCTQIACHTGELDWSKLAKLGDPRAPYLLYRDDGYTTNIDFSKNLHEI